MPDQEISFEEMMGTLSPRARVDEPDISFEDLAGEAGPVAKKSKAFWVDESGHTPFPLIDAFFESVASKTKKAAEALFSPDPAPAERKSLLETPNMASGTVKALGGGVLSLAEMAGQGVMGILNAGGSAMVSPQADPFKAFMAGHDETQKFFLRAHEVTEKITGINLAPADKQEEAVAELLAVIPEAGHAIGETTYEKTGSAIAGAGSEALFVLLTLKPSVAADTLGALKSKGKGAAKIEATFDELAGKNPEGAAAVAEHVKRADPELGVELEARAKKAEKKSPEELGKEQARARTAEKEISYEELLKSEDISYEDLIAAMEEKPVATRSSNLKNNASGESALAGAKAQLDQLSADRMASRQEAIGDGMRDAAQDAHITLASDTSASAFNALVKPQSRIPGYDIVKGKLTEYADQLIRTFAPEALGPAAKTAGATLAKTLSEQMQKDSSYYHRAKERIGFWNKAGQQKISEFVRDYETGMKSKDPKLAEVAEGYRAWNDAILKQDEAKGIQYDARENYLYHAFENSEQLAAFMTRKYGSKWGNPKFIKDRTFELYEEAKAAGFKPKFSNPEEIMLARQHASDVAQMRIDTLADLERFGVAYKVTKANAEKPRNLPMSEWRAPNGERYWVHDDAGQILHNAFNTASLWNMQGIAGDAFRGAMFLKNTLVPVKLALNAFHPLHVATIDNATAMVRISEELLSGVATPTEWVNGMLKAATYGELLKETGGQLASAVGRDPTGGNRLLKVWQGKIKDGELTQADTTALQFMVEGGFIPELSSQYRTKALDNFQAAVQKRSATAVWHAPFAALSLLNKPMFEIWIPGLKIASYLRDVGTALKVDPSMLDNPLARQLAFRKLAKSVDNRYGEMAYNTMFWNRWVKDLGVANTLSLSWQMGFLREYGGGTLDVGQMMQEAGSRLSQGEMKLLKQEMKQNVKAGRFRRPLFVTFYTAQALLYAGLITWAMTGKPPSELLDYTHPKSGEDNEDGSPQRLNTMFYPREFVSIAKHIEHQGVISGLGHLASSKASGVVGQTAEWLSGVNSFGQEIRDPNAPFMQGVFNKELGDNQLEQTLAATLFNLEPISLKAVREGQNPALAFAGFGIAPKYITESDTMSRIREIYTTYYAKKQTPYEKAQASKDRSKLAKYWEEGDSDKFGDLLDQMQEKYDLTGQEFMKLQQSLAKHEDPGLAMFKNFTWQQQKRLLDKMTAEEREIYLPLANRAHLRYSYEEPETP